MNWFSKIKSMCGFNSTQKKEEVDYSSMKVAELKAIAKEKGVKGYYKLKKSDLINILGQD